MPSPNRSAKAPNDPNNQLMRLNTNQILITGCDPGNSNLGVAALFYSIMLGLDKRLPDFVPTVVAFDNENRDAKINTDGRAIRYRSIAINPSRRIYSSHSSSNISMFLKLGLYPTEATRAVKNAKVMLDISAGDSFSDIYGQHRFDSICFLKEVMAKRKVPTVLLPQTYGPFKTLEAKSRAAKLVQSAAMAWARDTDSGAVMRELLHDQWNDSRHKVGVDVAFALPISRPSVDFASRLEQLKSQGKTLLGFNISGLIYNSPELSKQEFGLKADYRKVVDEIVRAILSENSDEILVLVPHVNAASGSRESDNDACNTVLSSIPSEFRERVLVAPAFTDPRQIKWVISQCDWFCGTRMHATIAGLSSAVATASIAYSMKTRGVFESCGMESQVIDPRSLDTEEVIRQTLLSVASRETLCNQLRSKLPETLRAAEAQMDAIATYCKTVLKS